MSDDYCIVDHDPAAGCAIALDTTSEPLEPLAWLAGRSQPQREEPVALTVRSQGVLPDLDSHLVPLASPRLRAVLDDQRIDNVQYRRAELDDRRTRVRAQYWLFNVLGLIAAVDRERSEAEPYLGGPGLVLGRFAIDARAADGARLFRLAEAPHLLIADAELTARLRASGLVGLRLRATEGYDGY